MVWKAANLSKKRNRESEQQQQASVTIEASLSQLHKHYATVMECLGAWHKAAAQQSNANSQKQLAEVGRAARQLMESTMFPDALILPHLSNVITATTPSNSSSAKAASHTTTPVVVVELTSHKHRETVRQIAYLTVVNYADMLVAGCPISTTATTSTTTLLDKGIVPPLPALQQSCWEEPPVRTYELALGALLDAVDIMTAASAAPHEGSNSSDNAEETTDDPMLWLKLACVARRLGRLRDGESDDGSPPHERPPRYARLERHALEMARTALPSHVPPNRLVLRALREEPPQISFALPPKERDDEAPHKVLHIPRYSWSVLGKLLLRSVINAEESRSAAPLEMVSPIRQAPPPDPHYPLVTLQMSPLLVLPVYCLGLVCQYLVVAGDGVGGNDTSSLGPLQVTCRALNWIVPRAREDYCRIERRRSSLGGTSSSQHGQKTSSSRDNKPSSISVSNPPQEKQADGTPAVSSKQAPSSSSASQTKLQDEAPKRGVSEGPTNTSNSSPADETSVKTSTTAATSKASTAKRKRRELSAEQRANQRVSKRVRSALISSGKRSERSYRRASLGYCLVGALWDVAPSHIKYKTAVALFDSIMETSDKSQYKSSSPKAAALPRSKVGSHANNPRLVQACERVSNASMSAFTQQWSATLSLPLRVLFGFVAHASIHIADVCASDPGGSMIVSSCLDECLQTMVIRSRRSNSLEDCWSNGSLQSPTGCQLWELVAIDLLHAELRLKRCDRYDTMDTDFDGDGFFLDGVIRNLLSLFDDEEESSLSTPFAERSDLDSIKARVFWLCANFNIWRSRIAQNITESRDAEVACLDFTAQALACLEHVSDKTIPTPHLVSPTRTASYWNECSVASLCAFRDEIQASSVVLVAQEQFLEVVSRLSNDSNAPISDENLEAFKSIGSQLLQRYDVPIGSEDDKYKELISDFLSVHEDELSEMTKLGPVSLESVDVEVMAHLLFVGDLKAFQLQSMRNPSILSILVSCQVLLPDSKLDVAFLFSRLAQSIAVLGGNLVVEMQQKNDGNTEKDVASTSDASSVFSDDSVSGKGPEVLAEWTLIRKYAAAVLLIVERARHLLVFGLTSEQKIAFWLSDELQELVNSAIAVCSTYCSVADGINEVDSMGTSLDFCILSSLIAMVEQTGEAMKQTVTTLFVGIVGLVSKSKKSLQGRLSGEAKRQERVSRGRIASAQIKLVAKIFYYVGQKLTEHSNGVSESLLGEPEVCRCLPTLTDSLLWFHGLVVRSDGTAASSNPEAASQVVALDPSICDALRVPLSFALVSVVNQASSIQGWQGEEDTLELEDFFDSDNSALDCSSEEDQSVDNDEGSTGSKRSMLRRISHAIYCVDHVLRIVSPKQMMVFSDEENYITAWGPRLPLLITRLLNSYSETLLGSFSNEKANKAVWLDFDYGTRSLGVLLDSLLHKTYKCLHGFTLVDMRDGKDNVVSAASDDWSFGIFEPENDKATVNLYRCIMRSYAFGKKSPPKTALELILNALPPVEEEPSSTAVNDFLFAPLESHYPLPDVLSVLKEEGNWMEQFGPVSSLAFAQLDAQSKSNSSESDLRVVRSGTSRIVAQGAIPSFQDDSSDPRISSKKRECAMVQKFNALMDDVCPYNILHAEGWYSAAQCALSRADLIADHLGLSRGFHSAPLFAVPEHTGETGSSLSPLQEILSQQDDLQKAADKDWLNTIGGDLSVCLRYVWFDDDSLKAMSEELSATASKQKGGLFFKAWSFIGHFLRTGDLLQWKQALGGLFVSSLRAISIRCYLLGFLALHHSSRPEQDKITIASEICEGLGFLFYSEISTAQVFGFPLHCLQDKRKRDLAETALSCFSKAASLISGSANDDVYTWDINFMIGKCHEKIASTITEEIFHSSECRKYKVHKDTALNMYASSFREAKELEDKGDVLAEQNGGSNHGSIESLYRLHSSRLKCLIEAVNKPASVRGLTELEALDLTEKHRFSAQTEENQKKELNVRERVWSVLVDIVSALAECRDVFSFFHRSVYRHAQAIQWSSVLLDPSNGRTVENLSACLPDSQVSGLKLPDGAKTVCDGAADVMTSIFDKKRGQLCAVWVAPSASTPFQSLNNTIRKYDVLRGKYVRAYLHSLVKAKRRNDVENFIRWISSSNRDFPSVFGLNILSREKIPPHTQDCLLPSSNQVSSLYFLKTTKRLANTALASLLLEEISDAPKKDQKSKELLLKSAFGCFLRMNCIAKAFEKNKWRRSRSTALSVKPVADALIQAYQRVIHETAMGSTSQSDWGGETSTAPETLKAAVDKCKELFPSATGAGTLRKIAKKAKKKGPSDEGKQDEQKAKKEGEGRKMFEVPVPEGLEAGGKFETSVTVEGVTKKVRLTIPESKPATMLFFLKVGSSDEAETVKKSVGEPRKDSDEKNSSTHPGAKEEISTREPVKLSEKTSAECSKISGKEDGPSFEDAENRPSDETKLRENDSSRDLTGTDEKEKETDNLMVPGEVGDAATGIKAGGSQELEVKLPGE